MRTLVVCFALLSNIAGAAELDSPTSAQLPDDAARTAVPELERAARYNDARAFQALPAKTSEVRGKPAPAKRARAAIKKSGVAGFLGVSKDASWWVDEVNPASFVLATKGKKSGTVALLFENFDGWRVTAVHTMAK